MICITVNPLKTFWDKVMHKETQDTFSCHQDYKWIMLTMYHRLKKMVTFPSKFMVSPG